MILNSQLNESKKVLPVLGMIIIIIVSLYFSKNSITGNIVAQISRLSIDISIDKSHSFIIHTDKSEMFSLNSFRLSGSILGVGAVNIYLDNNAGIRRLVYSNIKGSVKSSNVLNDFTKNLDSKLIVESYMPINNENLVSENNQEFVSGNFRNACIDTCELDASLFNTNRYELIVYVDPGVSVHLNEVLYT